MALLNGTPNPDTLNGTDGDDSIYRFDGNARISTAGGVTMWTATTTLDTRDP
jgi:hypothetical protein